MSYKDYSEEVKNAKEKNMPIVAIETVGIFEGIPGTYDKIATAERVSDIIRENGAVPAFIAIVDGRLKIGFSDEDIKYFAEHSHKAVKTARRDISIVMAKKGSGMLTIAASMAVAEQEGFAVVLGGAIGGVHKSAEKSMDISNDLEEIPLRKNIVVCSGVKSILDLRLTVEYMETKGIPVIGFGTDRLPSYITRDCGFKTDYKMNTAEEIAETIKIKNEIGIKGGIVVANPISEKYAVSDDEMNKAINRATTESVIDRIMGKEITVYIMNRVRELLGEKIIKAQKEMICGNADVAAKIAVEYYK